MATVAMQRDLVVTLKKETILNLGILSKLQQMPSELNRLIFKENALEKPTQNFFNHLSYYLVSIIDIQASGALPWPLYDTKTERSYRNELSAFISDYSNKGLLSPVMSSYLVNPGCYKVTVLIFQMSQLAVERVLITKMNKDTQRKLYDDMREDYKTHKEGFVENIDKETVCMSSKFSNYLCKRAAMEKIADLFRTKIIQMENKMSELNVQKYLDNIIDGFLKKHTVDEGTKKSILDIKDINKASSFFDAWLTETDNKITELEREWDLKIEPFLKSSIDTRNSTEMLIARQTGEAERSSYTLEYDPKTDYICTKELESQVNTEQKYILKNITRDDKLSFPNLIRAFLVSICFILKNAEISDDIYKFNEYLDGGRRNFSEIVAAMKILLDRVMNAEARLQPAQTSYNQSISLKEYSEIPPLPDLAELKMSKDLHAQAVFDTFTPLNISKHQFNLRRRASALTKPQSRSLLIAPFYHGPRDDFLKSLISCRISAYDRPNATQNFNMSILSQTNCRNNETIAECSSGFTKQQIMRLLSTKKSSSSKKFKYKIERPDIKVKKGGLFNESLVSNDGNGLIRSHSSPNLFEAREKRSKIPVPRKLSIMQEDCPLLEVSGISALDKENSYGTPDGVMRLESTRRIFDATSMPVISITPEPDKTGLNDHHNNEDSNKVHFADLNVPKLQENLLEKEEIKTETPKSNAQLIRKTSSLEKIINRFKKVRASVLPCDRSNEDMNEFKTIVEEKENFNSVNVDVFTANRVLLPDLLSPSCSVLPKKSADYLDEMCFDDDVPNRKPRESLGTALGVDHTFLDQFDLID
uniref:HAUS augmin-like complex subunit 6 N-terminal domain-containing protein n=1 Tax=Heliothis virescens TaxID=7102 RepID=A0A2A4J0S6_HELVI